MPETPSFNPEESLHAKVTEQAQAEPSFEASLEALTKGLPTDEGKEKGEKPTHFELPWNNEEKSMLAKIAIELKTAKETKDYPKVIELANLLKEKINQKKKELSPKSSESIAELSELLEQEQAPSISEQYESQSRILESSDILETLSTGEKGIIAIDGKEYPFPTLEQVTDRLKNFSETLKPKLEQGLTKMLIVPKGKSLDSLIQKTSDTILKHHKEGKLFATKLNPKDTAEPLVPLKLDESKPLWHWGGYDNADTNGKLVYYPKQYDKDNHQGQTKQELIDQGSAWDIIFIEDLPNLPAEGEGKVKAGRKQLEANLTPKQYLEELQKEEHTSESGLTPEDWLTYMITNLEETNQVIDDYDTSKGGQGKICYNLGGYFPDSSVVSHGGWSRDNSRAGLGRSVRLVASPGIGSRPSVRIP